MPFTTLKDTLQGLKEQNHSTDKITVGRHNKNNCQYISQFVIYYLHLVGHSRVEISLNIRQEVLRKTLKGKN